MPPATSTGMVLSGAFLGTVLWPPVFGVAAEVLSYAAAFTIAAIMISMAMTAAAYSQRRSEGVLKTMLRSAGPLNQVLAASSCSR